jgi:hypothetical protein
MTYLHGTGKPGPFLLECYAAVVPIAINDSHVAWGSLSETNLLETTILLRPNCGWSKIKC